MYGIILQEKAERFLKKLDRVEQKRLIEKLEDLKHNAHLGKPMTGELAGIWSLRTGKYRTLYQIYENKLVILVLKIDHRKNAS